MSSPTMTTTTRASGARRTRSTPLSIGNAGGYWGDDPNALLRQVNGGRLDYITLDFLAEITMSILQKQRSRNPSEGYARDFIPMLEAVLPALLKNGTKIITNAGGVNPLACAQAIEELGARLGVKPRIAVVYGDDILAQVGALTAKGVALANMETGESLHSVASRLRAANVYFGALPVAEALAWEPDVIVTGRVTDTGITLAPMIHEFGWRFDDWDKLASGIVAGHILECGAQSTGGNFTDWRQVEKHHDIGYPIAEVSPDGSFVITKHRGSGGLVSVNTVREQLVYEMGDPRCYITPDVVADFSTIQLRQDGPDRVAVFGIKGYEPTPFYKVSMAYSDGFKVLGQIVIAGPDARAKAERFADIFWHRVGKDFAATETEYFGWNACQRSLGAASDGEEIMLRVGARADEEARLRLFSKTVPSLILSGPPGVTVVGGAPKAQEVVSYWPALIPKECCKPQIALFAGGKIVEEKVLDGVLMGRYQSPTGKVDTADKPSQGIGVALHLTRDRLGQPLSRICLARSGDKGDTANIGLLARGPKAYEFIGKIVTAQFVKDAFQELCHGRVTRHPVDTLMGYNFLLEQSLGGGGTLTLRADAQGKTFAQALLRQRFIIPDDVLAESAKSPLQ